MSRVAARAGELIRLLRLEPHPEGGHYREIFRSGADVATAARGTRRAVTGIYYLLAAGSFSAGLRVRGFRIPAR